MMRQPPRCIATDVLKLLCLLALLCVTALAHAASIVGTVMNLSGPLLAKKADGKAMILSVKSSVEQGDILITEKDTYARVRFIDNSEMTLKPNTQLKVDNFVFDEQKQESDQAKFSLVKGGLRAVTGALGKRSKERFGLDTPAATIGIRGTTFIAEYVEPDVEAVAAYIRASVAANGDIGPIEPLQLAQLNLGAPPSNLPKLSPGLYVQVIDGMIHVTNPAGTMNFSAGQFGFTASFRQPPVIIPNNPGLQFTPPPAFNSSSANDSTASNIGKTNNIDCEVR
jgi:hypothetical protein